VGWIRILRAFPLLLCSTLLGVAWLATPASSYAGEDDLRALPTENRFGCLNCHAGNGATATTVPASTALNLNQFGLDWLNFGSVWSPEFAAQNSDGDGCSNGFEMGDPAGSWTPTDSRISIPLADQRNPGDASDCALPIGEDSWGTLKSLFGS